MIVQRCDDDDDDDDDFDVNNVSTWQSTCWAVDDEDKVPVAQLCQSRIRCLQLDAVSPLFAVYHICHMVSTIP